MKESLKQPIPFPNLDIANLFMEGIELNALFYKVLLEGNEETLRGFIAKFEFIHCLVDGDGYSVELIYTHELMAV